MKLYLTTCLFLSLYWAPQLAFARSSISSVNDLDIQFQNGKILSVEDILDRLPGEMLAKPVIVPHSQSQHRRTTTVRRPRTILGKNDASFYIAYPTNELSKSYNQIELAQQDKLTKEISLYLADLSSSKPTLSQKNPEECLHCHLHEGRVVLRGEEYPFWGWFGTAARMGTGMQEGQNVALVANERREIAEFLNGASSSGRLARLPLQGYDIHSSHQFSTRMTALFNATESSSLFQLIKSFPEYERLKYAIVDFQNTDLKKFSSSFPAELAEDFKLSAPDINREIMASQKSVTQSLKELFLETYNFTVDGIDSALPTSADKSYTPLTLLEWLLRRHGMTLHSFSTYGSRAYTINDGSGNLLHALATQVALDIATRDRSFRKRLTVNAASYKMRHKLNPFVSNYIPTLFEVSDDPPSIGSRATDMCLHFLLESK